MKQKLGPKIVPDDRGLWMMPQVSKLKTETDIEKSGKRKHACNLVESLCSLISDVGIYLENGSKIKT